MEILNDILRNFDPISLREMDKVSLMERKDSKYVFNVSKLPDLLAKTFSEYFILEVNEFRLNQYKTLYYDTNDFEFYHQHLHGSYGRDKIRFRTYVCSDHHYFEIKNKNNKELTQKKRVRTTEDDINIKGKAEAFLTAESCYNKENLNPKIWVNYSRITLVNKDLSERLTLDVNLEYEFEGKNKTFPELVIAELKHNKNDHSSFNRLMRSEHIRESSFSKYCMGIVFLYPELKSNRFKPILLHLNKLCHVAI
ncbi:MAG: polyphosphate polymerase domain-containing protein [Bacteroidota bacterium]